MKPEQVPAADVAQLINACDMPVLADRARSEQTARSVLADILTRHGQSSPSGLPPFSGDDPTCVKCGKAGARTNYRPPLDTVADLWDPDRFPVKGEYLERKCRRCDYAWPEATVTTIS